MIDIEIHTYLLIFNFVESLDDILNLMINYISLDLLNLLLNVIILLNHL